ncbi:MAG: bifunctional proline dehydrogenase/L-glutamate gamma-semialdehyde dehydrogenase PutA, partial [Novosphingobium sp.]
ERLAQAAPASAIHAEASALASRLIEAARANRPRGLDAFLQSFGLGTEEGVAMMCLAEALLRVPDARTADALIHDKLAGIDWAEHLGESSSAFVNAATFSLMLTGRVLDRGTAQGLGGTVRRAIARMGEPVIREAVVQAMRILGGQFVFGRTIDEALARAQSHAARGESHSFDMLGEAAMTAADAERYRASYAAALARIAAEAKGGVAASPGISVKLSALYPRYDFLHADAAKAALLPILKNLAVIARDADIHFTIDAEEAERLELSMEVIEALVADDDLFRDGWQGFGLALQAYQKRAVPLADWVIALARQHRRKLMVRLVKGAYWDSEIKLSQVGGHPDYPVFTRKLGTDVSYLACAARLLAASDAIYPAFATHNAYTIAAVKALAAGRPFEFQRLHGMGTEVYDALAALEAKSEDTRSRVRVYAPVGGHKDLLAYLVRRLLENGANTSFVNRMADADVPVAVLVTDPVGELRALSPHRNPAIPRPPELFAPRRNSSGVDLADPLVMAPLAASLQTLAGRDDWVAEPSLGTSGGAMRDIRSPHDRGRLVGRCRDATAADVAAAMDRAEAAQPAWDALSAGERARRLEAAAERYESHRDAFLSLCQREAGKTLGDAVLELREAVDFLRYYAAEARRLFDRPEVLPGPTGEDNRLALHGRGVFAAIAPWNFPLAIFTGLVAGPLAAGNAVLAKPAEQTPLIAALAVRLLHESGIPRDVLHLLPGDGSVGAAITADPRLTGVAFTGSTGTARVINRTLASRDGPLATIVAETGGQNAMIVDSSALPEQVTRDVLASAFQSAGQRCSALRVLYLQEEVADAMLDMIRGGCATLVIGDPQDTRTDVGPVIDDAARTALQAHVDDMRAAGHRIWQRELPAGSENGSFFPPTIIEINGIAQLDAEHFGPVLHVARFASGKLGAVIEAINASGFG